MLQRASFFRTGLMILLLGIGLATPWRSVAQPAATEPCPAAPAVIDWLDRIQAKSDQIKTFQADIRFDRIQGLVRDKQRRFGTLIYVVGPPRKFAIHFDRLLVGDRLDHQDRWYIYDGTWLVERLDAEHQFTKRQVVAPDAPADKANPLDLGEGPFALPLTTRKERILQRFDVSLANADNPADAPPNSVHLKLIPRENYKSDYTQVDLWYDCDSLLPVRARTLDESENETVIQVSKPRLNEPVEEKVFDTREPQGGDWRVEVTPWEPR